MLILARVEVISQPDVIGLGAQFDVLSENLIRPLKGVGIEFEINPYRLEETW
jgi:hypothetical protein